jgi:hypothetical protein
MGGILWSLERKPYIPRDVLTGTFVRVKVLDRLAIDSNGKIVRVQRTTRMHKNVRDIRAISRDVEACCSATGGAVEGLCRGIGGHHEPGSLDCHPARSKRCAGSADQEQEGES